MLRSPANKKFKATKTTTLNPAKSGFQMSMNDTIIPITTTSERVSVFSASKTLAVLDFPAVLISWFLNPK